MADQTSTRRERGSIGPVPGAGRLLELLRARKYSLEALEELAAALLHCLSHPPTSPPVLYAAGICRRATTLLQEGENVSPSLVARFLVKGSELLGFAGELRRRNVEDNHLEDVLGAGIDRIFNTLDEIFGAAYRYRLYTIHPDQSVYRGLKSISMPSSYMAEFDVAEPAQFGRTKEIPFAEPPYERVPQTFCARLAATALDTLEEESKRWYVERLGLGDPGRGVPESYTWELTLDGPAQEFCLRANPDLRPRYAVAFSLDAGDSLPVFDERVLTVAEIHMLDELWQSSFGSDFAQYFYALRKALQASTVSGRRADLAATAATTPVEELWYNTPHRQIGWGPIVIPWVYSADDEAAEFLNSRFSKLRNVKTFVLLTGPSGVGKQSIAEALHYNGNRGGGPWERIAAIDVVDGATSKQVMYGSVPGAFTGAVDAPGIFERTHAGTLLLDEIYKPQSAERDKFLTPLADLAKNPIRGFTRQNSDVPVVPDVRVVATGNPSADDTLGDLRRRFPAVLPVPGWYSLTAASRVAIIRWLAVQRLRIANCAVGTFSQQLLSFLTSDVEIADLLDGNMHFVTTWLEECAVVSNGCAEWSLKGMSLDGYPTALARAQEILSRDGPESVFLSIGAGSPFEESLTDIQRLALDIARAHPNDEDHCDGCIDPVAAIETLKLHGGLEAALSAWYILLAAANTHTAYVKNEDDKYQTAPTRLKRHFGKQGDALLTWLETNTGFQPNDFRSKGTANHPGWSVLLQHFDEHAPTIVTTTFGIQCAYPTFPDFPYWRRWLSETKEISHESPTRSKRNSRQRTTKAVTA